MSRRRDADRAEAIVKAAGALVLLALVYVTSKTLPGYLKGKSAQESLDVMFNIATQFIVLALVISIAALLVWWAVLRRK